MKTKQIIAEIEADGWRHVATTGSHRHFKPLTKPGKVTVAGKSSCDLPPKTIASIRKQAGL